MTKYLDNKRIGVPPDAPISLRNYENDNSDKTYYCNFCQRNLIKLIDSSHQNVSFYCQNCSMTVNNPEESKLRAESDIYAPSGVNTTPYATSKFKEPSVNRKPKEIRGGLAALQQRGMKITSYTETNVRRERDEET